MTDLAQIRPSHTQRAAYVYIRQSTPGQVEPNRESTARQYALADRAGQLGGSPEQVVLIDEDLGLRSLSGRSDTVAVSKAVVGAGRVELPFSV